MSLIVCRTISDTDVLSPRGYRAGLGANVRRLREAQGWSREEYANRAGIHRTYVSDNERGRRSPTVTVVEELAAPLKVRTGELLD